MIRRAKLRQRPDLSSGMPQGFEAQPAELQSNARQLLGRSHLRQSINHGGERLDMSLGVLGEAGAFLACQTALWEGLREGWINTVGTDNTSRALATKKPEAGLHGSRPGLPALGTHLPALLHYGRMRGVPLEILVERATRSPALVYGIYPQKGTIAVGSDADLVIVDLEQERVVRAEDLQGMSDFSPFEGKRLRGWPVATIKGGQIVARDGKIVAKANGND
jgi:N-acyl-D-aspartate/D-glutamate deacylase